MLNYNHNTLQNNKINNILFDYLQDINIQATVLCVNEKIKHSNNLFHKITGYKEKQINGSLLTSIIPDYFKDEWNYILETFNESVIYKVPVICSDKNIIIFNLKGRSTYHENHEILFLKFEHSYLGQNKMDLDSDLHRSILNSVSENILIINKDLEIVQTIKIKSEKLLGITSLSEVFSSNAIKNIDKNINTINSDLKVFEINNYKTVYEARLVPYKSDYYVLAFNDISLKKRIENKLIDSQIQLKQLNDEKDLLLSIIAHDLKNPFNIINGFCSVLINSGKNFDDFKKHEIIEHIYTASISGHSLLVNLLEWSRSQSNRILFSPEKINIREMCTHIVHFYLINISNKKIFIDNNIEEHLWVHADKNMLSTILRNVISNAIKYTSKSGTIRLEAIKNDTFIEIHIKDDGIGLTEKQIENLFKIGKNYSTKGTLGEKGTGLGLLLCKEFIEKHKGIISVKSSPGNGSEFIFTIPEFNEK